MHTSSLEKVHDQEMNKSSGLLTFEPTNTNIFMVTHDGMYRYLPITNESAINTRMHGTGAILIRRSKEVENIFTIVY